MKVVRITPDGDELNMSLPQDHGSRTEVAGIMSVGANLKNPQSGQISQKIHQDALTGMYCATFFINKVWRQLEQLKQDLEYIPMTNEEYKKKLDTTINKINGLKENENLSKEEMKQGMEILKKEFETLQKEYKKKPLTKTKYNEEYKRLKQKEKELITPESTFNDMLCMDDLPLDRMWQKLEHIMAVYEELNIDRDHKTWHSIISMFLPDDFEYELHSGDNDFVVHRGVIVSGYINSAVIGQGPNSIVYVLEKYYGRDPTVDFISTIQFMGNHYLMYERGFSIGIGDSIIEDVEEEVNKTIAKCYEDVDIVMKTEKDKKRQELSINTAMNNAVNISNKLMKEIVPDNNNAKIMIDCGAKGKPINMAQIGATIGQQNVDGKRMETTRNGRSLPHFAAYDTAVDPDAPEHVQRKQLEKNCESRGFVKNNYIKGLTPAEFFFHASGGREGVIDTACKTSVSGYISRRLMKVMEDLSINYDQTVRNSAKMIVQFNYGSGLDPSHATKMNGVPQIIDIKKLALKLNADVEWERRGDVQTSKQWRKFTTKLI